MSDEIENVELTASTAAAVSEEDQMPSNAQQLTSDEKKQKETQEGGEKEEGMDKMGKPKDKIKFKKPMLRAESEDLNIENLFKIISRCQSDRMDDQRAFLNPKDSRAQSKRGKLLRSASSGEKIIISARELMWDRRTNLQSERMNYQRAESRPVVKKPLKATKRASLPGLQSSLTKPEEDFLDLVARMQGSRMEDQRTELPDLKPEERPKKTLPDDDFFDQLMRAQADRMDDQRATMPAKSESSDKGDSSCTN